MAKFPLHIPEEVHLSTEVIELTITTNPHFSSAIRVAHRQQKWRFECGPDCHATIAGKTSLRTVLERQLRPFAKAYLTQRTLMWSKALETPVVASVTIKDIKSRWGSCSTQHNINLNLWLILLPLPFIDFVIKHELAHLTEMNHGERFHALLNQYTEQQSSALEKNMRFYLSHTFPFRFKPT